jgi:hypothetical protein
MRPLAVASHHERKWFSLSGAAPTGICTPHISANEANEKNIRKMFDNMKFTFQKVGLVKYDAFNEMGGKLSFSLAMLNESDNGFVLNAVHSREGCYTYIKEIIDGNSIITLAEEEQEALKMAKESTGSNPAK